MTVDQLPVGIYIFADAIAAQRAKIAATFEAINFKPKL